jgi:hypothetical protein
MVRSLAFTVLTFGLLGGQACSSSTPSGPSSDAAVDSSNGTGGRASGGATGGNEGIGGNDGGSPTGGRSGSGATSRDASVDGGTGHDVDAAADSGALSHFLWQLFYGRSFAAHVVVDSKDAPIVSGTFFDTETVKLGAFTLTSRGAADIMLSRVLPSGQVDWARSYGSTAEDYPLSFVLDGTDRITLSGLYNGTGNIGGPDFPGFAGTAGRYDVFAAGLTRTGDYRWQTTINATSEAIAGQGLDLNASSDLYLVGQFLGTTRIGGVDHASAGSWDAFFARFDEPNGALSAALTFGGAGDERAIAAVATPTDAVVFGTFQGTVTFPTTPPKTLVSAGGRDVFVARVSPAGVMTSVTGFGGAGDEELTNARPATDGSIVVAGSFTSASLSVLGGMPLVNAGGADIYLAKLAPDLSLRWSMGLASTGDARSRDVALGPTGDIALTGEFTGTFTVGSRAYEAAGSGDAGLGQIDAFVAKLDKNGIPLWSATAGGDAPDRGLGVALDSTGAVYLTAAFQSPVDFGGRGERMTPEPGQWASALVKYAP